MSKKEEKKKTEAVTEEVKEETVTEEVEEKVEEKPEEKPAEKTEEEKLRDELAKQKDSYMRLAAEYDNYRKRTQQEKLGIYDDATAKAVEGLLPMADALQMALQTVTSLRWVLMQLFPQ